MWCGVQHSFAPTTQVGSRVKHGVTTGRVTKPHHAYGSLVVCCCTTVIYDLIDTPSSILRVSHLRQGQTLQGKRIQLRYSLAAATAATAATASVSLCGRCHRPVGRSSLLPDNAIATLVLFGMDRARALFYCCVEDRHQTVPQTDRFPTYPVSYITPCHEV